MNKFYNLQKQCPVKNDWTLQIEEDKKEINMSYSDDDIKTVSKNKFKRVLKEKISAAALKYLNKLAEGHTKSKKLIKSKFKCENYITDHRFTSDEVKLCFQLRTFTFAVKSNFKNMYLNTDLLCELCRLSDCDENHLISCFVMRNFVPELCDTVITFDDVFGNTSEQLAAVKLFAKITRMRTILFDALSLS